MNILYFGTICDIEKYNKLIKKSHQKPSVASIVFETALLEGFKKNNVDMEIHSFPMIPAFPHSNILYFGDTVDHLKCGYKCRWLSTINIPVLKQISRCLDARKILKKWVKENREDGVIITYSIPPFLVNEILKYKRKYNIKAIAIVPDLLRDMYINENSESLITKLKQMYIKPALKLQGRYDGYVYLTDTMHNIVAPTKPYIVIEGIASDSTNDEIKSKDKSCTFAIMYAGMLHEKYGILNLVNVFKKLTKKNIELWLFGDGTATPIVKDHAIKDQRIKYFGAVNRETVLEYEKKASILVNPRNPKDEFTLYSFPSKTIEYMLSGTPLLTTRLKGIPEEYFKYVFSVDDNSVDSLVDAINSILDYSKEDLSNMGMSAKKFIIEEKNSYKQTGKIIKFIGEVQCES